MLTFLKVMAAIAMGLAVSALMLPKPSVEPFGKYHALNILARIAGVTVMLVTAYLIL